MIWKRHVAAALELLVLTKGRKTTATEVKTDNAVAMCAYGSFRADDLDRALQITADWSVKAGQGQPHHDFQ
jgi:hypothetical protein